MKKKFLIGGGITALVAAIVVIVVLAQGGNYFKGSTESILEDPVMNDEAYADMYGYETGPYFYVDSNRPDSACDYVSPLGSKDCPFKTIKEAVDVISSYPALASAEIKIAKGNYMQQDSIVIDDITINISGGWDSSFSSQSDSNITNFTGSFVFSNVKGGIRNLSSTLNGGSTLHPFIEIDNTSGENQTFTIEDLIITNKIYDSVIVVKGDSVTTKNILQNIYMQDNVSEQNGLITIEGNMDTTIRNCHFNRNTTMTGVLDVDTGVKIYNNLFTKQKNGTNSIIYVENGKYDLIANNTFDNNSVIKAIIYQKSIEQGIHIYNNIISNSSGMDAFDVFPMTEGLLRNNAILNNPSGIIKHNDQQIVTCNPNFQYDGSNNAEAWKLGEDSSCINAGHSDSYITNHVKKDYFGTSRPQRSGIDVGFHEVPSVFIGNIVIEDHPTTFIPFDNAVCGDGTVDEEEECDDGNTENGDGCDSNCNLEEEPQQITPVCGNGSLESGEECDDGNTENGDGCDSNCDLEEEETDVCTNIEGVQTSVPSGYEEIGGICTLIEEVEVECGDWTDVSSNDQEYDIWMYLCDKDIVKGNADGTLRPDDKLNRAELLALAFRASDNENVYNVDGDADYCFPDVKNEWFAKYFCTAKNKGFIEGYQDGYAKPGRNVILAEGLKIFLGALDEPFDVSDPDCWYCDMVDEAGDDKYLPYSFSDPTQVGPIELTRRKAFNMLYRIMIYK